MAEQIRSCSVCGNKTSTLYALPKNEELRTKWLEFIFGAPPDFYNASLVVCCDHFHESDFTNYGAYSRGFSSRLILKPGVLPSLRSTTTDSQTRKSQTLVTPHSLPRRIHTCTQTDTPSRTCRATQLSMSTLGHRFRSKGTQTDSLVATTTIATSTLDAPWAPANSAPLRTVYPRPAKRPRVYEEEEDEEEKEEDKEEEKEEEKKEEEKEYKEEEKEYKEEYKEECKEEYKEDKEECKEECKEEYEEEDECHTITIKLEPYDFHL
ncbi:hypothetical protein AMEX_G23189 [Astyanax mexicanus]|uniref:THAP-type domain-containing protein n=1 Tax=Astyanax mexicanus TaxID=7994 RepID=A0A8T2KVA4_ASTMX|nr:hypothetical protein AMEX_G23189 [Astyanax mexicanus]